MRIGVLALQGAFAEHIEMLSKLGAEGVEIRQRSHFDDTLDGLILPGGESTVMSKLLRDLGLFEPIYNAINNQMPVFGTCAGLILLAKHITGTGSAVFGTMDITARRNAYGRQLGSFFASEDFGGIKDVPMTFIRAPYIESAGSEVTVLSIVDGHIAAARQDKQLVTAFHPELSDNTVIHKYFLESVVNHKCQMLQEVIL